MGTAHVASLLENGAIEQGVARRPAAAPAVAISGGDRSRRRPESKAIPRVSFYRSPMLLCTTGIAPVGEARPSRAIIEPDLKKISNALIVKLYYYLVTFSPVCLEACTDAASDGLLAAFPQSYPQLL